MFAYLIDPHKQTIERVDYDGQLETMYRLTACDCLCNVNLKRGDTILLDDEGLFREGQAFFCIEGYGQPLAGYGLVTGSNLDGDTTSPKMKLEALQQSVTWIGAEDAQFMHDEANDRARRYADEMKAFWPGVEVIHCGRIEIPGAKD